MTTKETWDFWFKACGATAAIMSAVGILFGGVFGVIQYKAQGDSAKDQRQEELRLMKFDQKKDVYYALSEAAVYVAHSPTLAEARQRTSDFELVYYGRAHILAMDEEVVTAKKAFQSALQEALDDEKFPSTDLQGEAFKLTSAIQRALDVEEIFFPKQEDE